GALHLVAAHRAPGQHRGVEQPEVARRRAHSAIPPSARTPGPISDASPTSTPVNAAGAKKRSAAAATSSGVTASSAAGYARNQSRSSPSAASAVSIEASPPWLSNEISSEPTA